MRKDQALSLTIDRESARLLRELAEAHTEGNKSAYIRYLIRLEAERRGLWPVKDRTSHPVEARP